MKGHYMIDNKTKQVFFSVYAIDKKYRARYFDLDGNIIPDRQIGHGKRFELVEKP